MQIQPKDSYHGSALTQIVEDPSFTALNKADEKYGHYLINSNIRLLVKHSTAQNSPWSYTFQPDDLRVLATDIQTGAKTFACLICGSKTICLLNADQIKTIINLNCSGTQWVRVEIRTSGGSLWVQGQSGEYRKSIPHTAFPLALFE
ncbi:MAG: hypothetical protein E6579_07605 [Clostridium sp.]|nr:hypothetical protein [Clostridium sp.]MDU6347556.1 hypothetical protein [Clostridium sp.]